MFGFCFDGEFFYVRPRHRPVPVGLSSDHEAPIRRRTTFSPTGDTESLGAYTTESLRHPAMKKRVSNRLIAALVAITAISSLALITSPSGATRTYVVDDDIACKKEFSTIAGLKEYFAVIAYGAVADGLKCSDLVYDANDPEVQTDNSGFEGVGSCGGVGDGICNRDDVVVIQRADLRAASDTSDCIRTVDGRDHYVLTSACVFSD